MLGVSDQQLRAEEWNAVQIKFGQLCLSHIFVFYQSCISFLEQHFDFLDITIESKELEQQIRVCVLRQIAHYQYF